VYLTYPRKHRHERNRVELDEARVEEDAWPVAGQAGTGTGDCILVGCELCEAGGGEAVGNVEDPLRRRPEVAGTPLQGTAGDSQRGGLPRPGTLLPVEQAALDGAVEAGIVPAAVPLPIVHVDDHRQ